MKLRCPAFENGDEIPQEYTGDGQNISPPLSWSDVPQEAKELALVVEDPDAGAEPFVHWLLYKIPPDVNELPQGLTHEQIDGALEGLNSWQHAGYEGPQPPPGSPHRYHFRLLALDQHLDDEPAINKRVLSERIRGHVVAEADLEGVYQRRPH